MALVRCLWPLETASEINSSTPRKEPNLHL